MAGFNVEIQALRAAVGYLDALPEEMPNIGATVVTSASAAMTANQTYATGPGCEAVASSLENALVKLANAIRDHGERMGQNADRYQENEDKGEAHFNSQLKTFGTARG